MRLLQVSLDGHGGQSLNGVVWFEVLSDITRQDSERGKVNEGSFYLLTKISVYFLVLVIRLAILWLVSPFHLLLWLLVLCSGWYPLKKMLAAANRY